MSKFKIWFEVIPISDVKEEWDRILKDKVLEKYPNVNLGEEELMPYRDMGGFIAIEINDKQVFDRVRSTTPDGVELAHTKREIKIEEKYYYWDFLCVILLELCERTMRIIEGKFDGDRIFSTFGDSAHSLNMYRLPDSNLLVEFHGCGLENDDLRVEISIDEFVSEVLRVSRGYIQALLSINPRLKEHKAIKYMITLCENLESGLASEKT